MMALETKRKAPGSWRATQGRIPVIGTLTIYSAGRWVQRLLSNIAWALGQHLSALDIRPERRNQK
jgi:hypothetical protein